MKRKILFVGMINSPHAARWISLIADQGWDLHFFPVYLSYTHSLMHNITIHLPWIKIRPKNFLRELFRNLCGFFTSSSNTQETKFNELPTCAIYPIPIVPPLDRILSGLLNTPLGESEVHAPLPFGPHVLARLIRQLKPDLIHSMEFQHAGYNVLRAKELIGDKDFPKWLATNWGSDIFYYRRFPEHHQQITRLLKNIDYYSCECERDVGLARDMGMTAKSMPVFPNTGGFNLNAITAQRNLVPSSARRVIMVKGYQSFAGRALTALDALLTCADILQDYRIIVFSASAETQKRIAELRVLYNLNITILPYSEHEKILRLFTHARIYLGVNISDAISTSMLEAMAMGAFPIQTNTSCCHEWIKDGVSGFVIPPDDVQLIGQRIREALTNDALVNNAAGVNWNTVCERLDQRLLKAKEIDFYNQIFADIEVPEVANAT